MNDPKAIEFMQPALGIFDKWQLYFKFMGVFTCSATSAGVARSGLIGKAAGSDKVIPAKKGLADTSSNGGNKFGLDTVLELSGNTLPDDAATFICSDAVVG